MRDMLQRLEAQQITFTIMTSDEGMYRVGSQPGEYQIKHLSAGAVHIGERAGAHPIGRGRDQVVLAFSFITRLLWEI
jgi:hypothetical protein